MAQQIIEIEEGSIILILTKEGNVTGSCKTSTDILRQALSEYWTTNVKSSVDYQPLGDKNG